MHSQKHIDMEKKADELMAVLDKDARHLEQSLSRLTELRSLVIKRDDAALGRLIDEIRTESDHYTANELKRQSIRKELAIALGCSFDRMTLSKLEPHLPQAKRTQVARMKTRLASLTKDLKKEHLNTTLLLSECARLNNMLLNGIFNSGGTGGLVYNADGAARRQTDKAFINLQF
jgi:hypothetical protein